MPKRKTAKQNTQFWSKLNVSHGPNCIISFFSPISLVKICHFETKVWKHFVLKQLNALCRNVSLSTLDSVFQNHRGINQDGTRVFMKRHSAFISVSDHKLNRQSSDLIEIKYFSSKDSEALEVPQRVCEIWDLGHFLTSNWNKPQGTWLN